MDAATLKAKMALARINETLHQCESLKISAVKMEVRPEEQSQAVAHTYPEIQRPAPRLPSIQR
jgi:molybdenum cofactor biosynthesis enzyme